MALIVGGAVVKGVSGCGEHLGLQTEGPHQL